jgi:hypothetical protein
LHFIILDLENREKEHNQPVHIINIDVADNHEDATLGAFLLYELAMIVSDWFNLKFNPKIVNLNRLKQIVAFKDN